MNRKSRRVNRWVDDLLHDRRPRRLRGGEQDVDALRAAIEMRSSGPDSGLPDPRFVESLRRRLARETQGVVPHATRMTRRGLLASGGLAAATAAAGLLVGERLVGGSATQQHLIPEGGKWVAVADLTDVPVGTAMLFSTGAVRGFVANHGDTVRAFSAVCTHLGCLLRMNADARRLDCPCDRTAFAFDGSVLFKAMSASLPSLPELTSRIHAGKIEVLTV